MVEGRFLRESHKVDLTDGGETALHSHAGSGSISHIPLASELTLPTFNAWTTITVSSCPANSIAEILISNRVSNNAKKYGGIRPVGSSLERRFQIQESEAGGESAINMLVKVNAGQQIQYFAEDSYIHMFVMGYLERAVESWIAGWNYRKSHSIVGSTGDLTDYQMLFKIFLGDGLSANNSAFLNFHGDKNDLTDIRFTKSDKQTILDHWIGEDAFTNEVITGSTCSARNGPFTVDGKIVYSFDLIDSSIWLIKSIDGGDSWSQVKEFADFINIKHSFVFVDSNGNIYCSGYTDNVATAGLYRSIDSGENFTRVLAFVEKGFAWKMAESTTTGTLVVGQYTVGDDPYYVGEARIYKSIDNGVNWIQKYVHATARHIHGVWYDPYQNYFYGSQGENANGAILRSINDGENWTAIKSGIHQWAMTSFAALNGARLWGEDSHLGKIDRTTDDSTFTNIFTAPTGYNTCDFFSADVWDGIAIFSSYISAGYGGVKPIIVTSFDTGLSWKIVKAFVTTDESKGAIIGNCRKGVIYCDDPDNPTQGLKLYVGREVWVEFDSIPAVGMDCYLYYGKSDASDISDIKAVFSMGDDFNDNTIDPALWTTEVTNGAINEVNQKLNETLTGGVSGSSALWSILFTDIDFEVFGRWYLNVFPNMAACFAQFMVKKDTANLLLLRRNKSIGIDRIQSIKKQDNVYGSETNVNWTFTYGMFKIKRVGSTITVYYTNQFGVWVQHQVYTSSFTGSVQFSYYISNAENYPALNVDWENVFIKKYVEPEPAHGAWGAEE